MRIPAIPLLATLSLLLCSTVEASPVWVLGNTCPATVTAGITRQYSVDQAISCVYDLDVANIQGTDAEADAYLNAGPQLVYGDGWEGLGQNPTGFSFTADAGNDDGTFTIGGLLDNTYDQFALGVKDGGLPKWAIFLLPVNTFSGDWSFLTSGGDLSHFTLYGRVVNGPPDDEPPDDEPPNDVVPEPATMILMGTGLMAAFRARKLAKK